MFTFRLKSKFYEKVCSLCHKNVVCATTIDKSNINGYNIYIHRKYFHIKNWKFDCSLQVLLEIQIIMNATGICKVCSEILLNICASIQKWVFRRHFWHTFRHYYIERKKFHLEQKMQFNCIAVSFIPADEIKISAFNALIYPQLCFFLTFAYLKKLISWVFARFYKIFWGVFIKKNFLKSHRYSYGSCFYNNYGLPSEAKIYEGYLNTSSVIFRFRGNSPNYGAHAEVVYNAM